MPTSYALEHRQVVPVATPADLAAAATTGDRVSLVNYRRCVIFVMTAAGTAGDDVTITLQEHTAATSGTSQNLVKISKFWHKTGATAINAVGQWTEVTQTAAATIDTATIDGAENEQLIAFEVTADMLSDGFDFISINLDDVGTNAQVGFAWYELDGARYQRDPANMASAIA